MDEKYAYDIHFQPRNRPNQNPHSPTTAKQKLTKSKHVSNNEKGDLVLAELLK